MTDTAAWLVNGSRDRLVRPDDRGFTYGDGLFETIAWRQGSPRFLDRHLRRLSAGCTRLGLEVPDADVLVDDMRQLAATHVTGTIRLSISRGPGPRGYAPPEASTPTRVVGFFPGTGPTAAAGLAVGMCRTPASANAALAGIKTLNRLDSVLARAEIARRGLDEGIMCTGAGEVVGATAANVFVVEGDALLTPEISVAGVAGIMRGVVLDCALALGLPVRELPMNVGALLGAEEIFLTNALTGLRPVANIEGRTVAGRQVTRRLAAALRERGVPEALAC